MIILGIETSCDETAAAIYDSERGLLSSIIASQQEHQQWGGVVPEVASRAHDIKITTVVDQALAEAGLTIEEVDRLAVTQGPGLVGALLVGICFAKGLSLQKNLPLVGVDHIDAHVYANFIEHTPQFPFISMVISGGHTQISKATAPFEHTLLGKTRDDAAGEAFDKTGKLLGLPYPAGPEMDRLARQGDPTRFSFPQAMLDSGYEFSFSGLKTSVLYKLRDEAEGFARENLTDLCAGIVEAVTAVLTEKLRRAIRETGIRTVLVAGGVSANSVFREKLHAMAKEESAELFIPKPVYCTDNAAMIAVTGELLRQRGAQSDPEMQPYTRYNSDQ